MHVVLHRAQKAFRESPAIMRGFVGGIGSGKSFVGAYDLVRRAKAGRLYMAVAPTYPMMRDATMRTFVEQAARLEFLRDLRHSTMSAVLGNGAEVLFRSADDPERLRGPNLSGVWLDEASLLQRAAWDIIVGRLREAGEQGWVSATFTPKGRQHWTHDVFAADGRHRDVALFSAASDANPFLPDGFVQRLREQYTSAFAEQELGGRFVDLAGTVARREWFRVIDVAPERGGRLVRAWDLAATESSAADYSVGTLLQLDGPLVTILDVVRERVAPSEVTRLIRRVAEQDGHGVEVAIEQEGGASGKIAASHLVAALGGFHVSTHRPSSDKVSRAMPFLSQAEAGHVRLVRASWLSAWLDEFTVFPSGAHDDQVDSAGLAYTVAADAPSTAPVYIPTFRPTEEI